MRAGNDLLAKKAAYLFTVIQNSAARKSSVHSGISCHLMCFNVAF